MQTNNKILLRGRLSAPPAPSHVNHGVEYFLLPLSASGVVREKVDELFSTSVSKADRDQLAALPPLEEDSPLTVRGEVRTFNNRSGVGSRLVVSVFARELTQEEGEDENVLALSGVLCKPPALRATPLGRTICDMILAINRRYGRADYLPCIAWGSLAYRCGSMAVGDPLDLEGRLQSRVYTKEIDGQMQERTAFEVSVMSLADPEDEYIS